MRQLHLVESLSLSFGGVARAAAEYCQALAAAGMQITLSPLHWDPEAPSAGHSTPNLQIVPVSGRSIFGRCQTVGRLIDAELVDCVHVHGLWSPVFAFAGALAKARNIPLAISPHGSLSRWALQYKRLKKWAALAVYQGPLLNAAELLFFTSERELEEARSLGITSPAAVLPLGVETPKLREAVARHPRTALFLSRLHPVKGIEMLLEAWENVAPSEWRLLIAGAGEAGYVKAIRERIRRMRCGDAVVLLGEVSGEAKERAFGEADIFVLPSYSENFGLVVAEAMARGVPVLTTTATPWEILDRRQCGWWVAAEPCALQTALANAMRLSPATLQEMGRRGRAVVEEEFAWPRIGALAVSAYQWALKGSAPPPCIRPHVGPR